jgi:solute:Na+ symporter, SSS family
MAATMLLLAGVCLCAVAQVLVTFLGWNFYQGVLVTAPVVLFYTWVGGLRATIYTELLHFVLVLAAIVPLVFLVARDFGGMSQSSIQHPAQSFSCLANPALLCAASHHGSLRPDPGIGVVLSFGFWSTDFVQMQRTLAVRRANDVAYVPLSMAAAKLIFAFLVVLPGVAAPLVLGTQRAGNWNATLPAMMLHYYSPPGWRLVSWGSQPASSRPLPTMSLDLVPPGYKAFISFGFAPQHGKNIMSGWAG